MSTIELRGAKLVEIPYLTSQLEDMHKSVLIVGERLGAEGVSETVKSLGFSDVTTTDILPVGSGSWLETNQGSWKHIVGDFVEFDESLKYDYIVSVSVFEHFGFWFAGNRMAGQLTHDDQCRWNHDIKGILKAGRLLKDQDSKLIITLPAGPFMNYEASGEPFQRSYDWRRQEIVKNTLTQQGFSVDTEKFYHTNNFHAWNEVSTDINHPRHYGGYCADSPNVIWALTIKRAP